MAKIPECGHPDRKHKGHGMCDKCYNKDPKVRERRNLRQKEYYATENGRNRIKIANDKYKSSPKGKSHYKEYFYNYNRTENKKAVSKRYAETDSGKEAEKRKAQKYTSSPHGKAKIRARENHRHHLRMVTYSMSHLKDEMESIYKECPKGYTVDHIIPLTHQDICGLHVPWNIQYLTRSDNSSKNNKFDGTYENESWRNDL